MFVGRAKRSAGNRQPVGSAAELYVNGSESESVQWCDCDWGDCGSCDLGDCGLDAVEVADGHKHDYNPVAVAVDRRRGYQTASQSP